MTIDPKSISYFNLNTIHRFKLPIAQHNELSYYYYSSQKSAFLVYLSQLLFYHYHFCNSGTILTSYLDVHRQIFIDLDNFNQDHPSIFNYKLLHFCSILNSFASDLYTLYFLALYRESFL